MLTKESILTSYKEYPFPINLFNKEDFTCKELILSKASLKPVLSIDNKKNEFSKAFIPQSEEKKNAWRSPTNSSSNPSNNTPNKGTKIEFKRGENYQREEPTQNIKIENLLLFNKEYNYNELEPSFYLRNKVQNYFIGPISSNFIINLYKNKKINSDYEFRLIDIFQFNNSGPFDFIPIIEINNDKWVEMIIDSKLLKYSKLFKEMESINKKIPEKIEKAPLVFEHKIEKIPEQTEKVSKEKLSIEIEKDDEEDEDSNQNSNSNNKNQPVSMNMNVDDSGKWEVVSKKKKKRAPASTKNTKPIGVGSAKIEEKVEVVKNVVNKVPEVKDEDLINMLKPKGSSNSCNYAKEDNKEVVNKDEFDINCLKEDEGFVEVKNSKKGGKKKRRPQGSSNNEHADIQLGFKYK